VSVLDEILARKRADVAERKKKRPIEAIERSIVRSERDFRRAIAKEGLSLIAEIKRRSPSKGLLRDPFDPESIAAIYDRSARAISVLTDEPYFGGSPEHLLAARRSCARPVLCKDFVVDPEYQIAEARSFGADAALLIARALSSAEIERGLAHVRALGMAAIVEVHDELELDRVLGETSAEIIGVNSRDLRTLQIDPDRVFALAPKIRAAKRLLIAESGLETKEGIDRLRPIADAVLIGTSLMRAEDIAQRLVEIGFPPEERRPEIKICGVRTREAAETCVRLGVDYVGFNFVPTSKRHVPPKVAKEIWHGLLGPEPVAVFVDPTIDQIEAAERELEFRVVQLHGNEPPELVARLRRRFRVIKAISIGADLPRDLVARHREAGAEILFDAPRAGGGEAFDWSKLESAQRFFLAGGLRPENVAEAIALVRPFAVDTASGVESNGVQDPDRIAAFCRAAREGAR
jgi:indole-3-glycerol phosphate synthase / phosphoribosylanthranilate isomerase